MDFFSLFSLVYLSKVIDTIQISRLRIKCYADYGVVEIIL